MSVSDLTDHTDMLASHGVQRRVAGLCPQGRGKGRATVAEWSFKAATAPSDEDGTAPTVLADRMGMTRGAISKLADRLVTKGLVARTQAEGRGKTSFR